MSGKKNIFFTMLIAILFFTACDSNRIYDDSMSIPETGWYKNDLMHFEIEVPDTINPYNFYLNVRNNTDYGFGRFYLFLNTRYPNGQNSRDTLGVIMADHTGKWAGKGFGRIKDQQVLLRQNMTFPQQGIYIFEIQHGMRKDTLFGIEDVGIRIEKALSE